MRRSAVWGWLLGAAAASLTSCASGAGTRCGDGAYGPGRGRRGGRPGPYCLHVESAGVGTFNLQVNRPAIPLATLEEGGDVPAAPTASAAAPGTPVTYALGPAPAGVQFVDICNAPGSRRTLASVDDQYAQIPEPGAPPVPFPMRVYDTPVTPPFSLSSNGWLAFAANVTGSLSGTVPDPSPPNLLVAPFWTDLHTRATGICYGSTGAAPNRAFVVQWQDLHFCCSDLPTVHLTFEVVIREARAPRTHNVIDVIYQSMAGAEQATGGAGLEAADGVRSVVIPGPAAARAVRLTPSR